VLSQRVCASRVSRLRNYGSTGGNKWLIVATRRCRHRHNKFYKLSTKNGFNALAQFDKPERGGNADGIIDKNDYVFSSLRLWQDFNHNGISELSELNSLPSFGLAIVSLDYNEARRKDREGNTYRYRAKVTDERGVQLGRWAWDVFPLAVP